MVVEHTFITTLEATDAIDAAGNLLRSRGFTALPRSASPVPPPWNVLEMRRGRGVPDRAKSILELPQFVRMEWDRGRVVVAASITPYVTMGRQRVPGAMRSCRIDARQPDQEHLLVALVGALETLLAHGRPADESVTALAAIENHLHDKARRARRRLWLILGGVFLAFITFVVYAAVYFD
jgi:hypothetical protein